MVNLHCYSFFIVTVIRITLHYSSPALGSDLVCSTPRSLTCGVAAGQYCILQYPASLVTLTCRTRRWSQRRRMAATGSDLRGISV